MIGVLLGLLSALMWALANAFIGPTTRRFGALGSLVWAQLMGGSLAVVVAFAIDGWPAEISTATAIAWTCGALAAAVAYGGLFESLRCGQLAVIAPIISSWAVISVGVGVFVFNERLSLATAVGVTLVVVGNIVLARYREHSETRDATPPRALLFAIASVLGFGVMVPCVELLGQGVGRLWTVPLLWGAELVLLLSFLTLCKDLPPRPRNLAELGVLSRVGLFEVSGFLAMSLALGAAPMSLVTPAASLSTAFSVAIGVLFLKEHLSRAALIGASCASVGVVVLGL